MEIKKSIRNIAENIIAQLLLGVVGVAVVILTWLRQLPLDQILLISLGVFGLVFLGLNQYAAWKERGKKKLPKLSDNELENTIREWLNIPAWKVQKGVLSADVLLSYDVTLGDLPIHIERQKSEPLGVLLAGEVSLTRQDKAMTDADWERLAGQISIEMARLGIQFLFTGTPNKRGQIRLIESVILEDSLTGFYFRTRVMFVVRALILVLEVAKEFFREIPNKPVPDKAGSQT